MRFAGAVLSCSGHTYTPADLVRARGGHLRILARKLEDHCFPNRSSWASCRVNVSDDVGLMPDVLHPARAPAPAPPAPAHWYTPGPKEVGLQGRPVPDPGDARREAGHYPRALPGRGHGVLVDASAGGRPSSAGGDERSRDRGGRGHLQRGHLGLHSQERA